MKSFDDVENYLIEKMNARGVPGFQVAIVQGDQIAYSKTFGYANIEKQIPVTLKTIFRVASVSKPVIATGLMQLVEKGMLGLNDTVNSVMKRAKIKTEFSPEPTIRDILCHTSGLPVHVDPTVFSREMSVPLEQMINDSAIAVKPPKKEIMYSNTAFNIIGYLVGELTDQPYPDYMDENFFKLLEMHDSAFEQTPHIQKNMAMPYARKGDSPLEPVGPWYGGSYPEKPCGSLFTTAQDLAKFLIAHMNDGIYKENRMLKKELVDEMHNLQSEAGSSGSGFALAWKRSNHHGRLLLSHTGGNLGWTAHLVFYPELKLGLALVCNLNDNTGWRPPAREALHIVAGGSLSFDAEEYKKPEDYWTKYTGVYCHGFQKATVKVSDGNLIFESGANRMILEEVNPGTCRVHGSSYDGLDLIFEDVDKYYWKASLESTTFQRFIEDKRKIDSDADLSGEWTGKYVHHYGYFPITIKVEDHKATILGMTGETVSIENLEIAEGRLAGESQFHVPATHVGWGADIFQVSISVSCIEGKLEGSIGFKSEASESKIPVVLQRV